MSVVLALGAAMVYGSADFLGGPRLPPPSRRCRSRSGPRSPVCSPCWSPCRSVGPAAATRADVLAGAVGGLFGGLGLVLLYRTLAQGP